MGTASSELCITCHEQMRPGMFRNGDGHEHPQNPPLRTAEQRQAIKEMGTAIGTRWPADLPLLSQDAQGAQREGDAGREPRRQQAVHPLPPDRGIWPARNTICARARRPRLNAQGQTAQQSGPCGACHTFHSYARKPRRRMAIRRACAQRATHEGKVASKHSGQPFSHPGELDKTRLPRM